MVWNGAFSHKIELFRISKRKLTFVTLVSSSSWSGGVRKGKTGDFPSQYWALWLLYPVSLMPNISQLSRQIGSKIDSGDKIIHHNLAAYRWGWQKGHALCHGSELYTVHSVGSLNHTIYTDYIPGVAEGVLQTQWWFINKLLNIFLKNYLNAPASIFIVSKCEWVWV